MTVVLVHRILISVVGAAAPTVAVPRESPRAAPIAIQMEIVPRVVLDITSRATSASNAEVGKQVLLVPRVPVPV